MTTHDGLDGIVESYTKVMANATIRDRFLALMLYITVNEMTSFKDSNLGTMDIFKLGVMYYQEDNLALMQQQSTTYEKSIFNFYFPITNNRPL
jgi:hypothetical protein